MKTMPLLYQKEITVRPRTGEGAFGPTFGAEKTVKARVVFRRRLIKSAQGDDLMAEATVLTDPRAADDIPLQAEVVIDGQTFTAQQSFKPENLNGAPLHQEVLLVP